MPSTGNSGVHNVLISVFGSTPFHRQAALFTWFPSTYYLLCPLREETGVPKDMFDANDWVPCRCTLLSQFSLLYNF
jgi:hypothetical protein